MNKIYILGALALAGTEAAAAAGYHFPATLNTVAAGEFVYALKTDCLASSTVTTLGMNNVHYQYYSFSIAAGTLTQATSSIGISVGATYTGSYYRTYTFQGCYHTHLYNFVAQPIIATPGVVAGLANQVVAYGYQLSGTAVTACTNTIAASLHTVATGVFTGAAWQTIAAYLTEKSAAAIAENTTIAQNIRVKVGTNGYENMIVKAATASSAFVTIITDGIKTAAATAKGSSNLYWDFMQTQVISGRTQFGRGGGSTTAPCGWYVLYAYEAPGPEAVLTGATTTAFPETVSADAITTFSAATVHLWTDYSIVAAASSVVLSAAGALLF